MLDVGGLEMKRTIVIARTIALLLSLIGPSGCGISSQELMATREATREVVLISFHDRFVTALGGGAGWLLRQESHLSDCGWFSLHFLEDGQVTLKTCHDQYVTAPDSGTTSADWRLFQQPELTDCGRFTLHEGSDGVALESCVGKYVTAGDAGLGWEGELAWSLVAETDQILAWELFTVLRR
jgi:hypothetical protein